MYLNRLYVWYRYPRYLSIIFWRLHATKSMASASPYIAKLDISLYYIIGSNRWWTNTYEWWVDKIIMVLAYHHTWIENTLLFLIKGTYFYFSVTSIDVLKLLITATQPADYFLVYFCQRLLAVLYIFIFIFSFFSLENVL